MWPKPKEIACDTRIDFKIIATTRKCLSCFERVLQCERLVDAAEGSEVGIKMVVSIVGHGLQTTGNHLNCSFWRLWLWQLNPSVPKAISVTERLVEVDNGRTCLGADGC
jgi:hypothetical protein